MSNDEYLRYLQSEEWRAVRNKVRVRECKRNGGRLLCERCGVDADESPYPMEVHHTDYSYLYRELADWDLATYTLRLLCRECHRYQHGKGPDPMDTDIDAELRRMLGMTPRKIK